MNDHYGAPPSPSDPMYHPAHQMYPSGGINEPATPRDNMGGEPYMFNAPVPQHENASPMQHQSYGSQGGSHRMNMNAADQQALGPFGQVAFYAPAIDPIVLDASHVRPEGTYTHRALSMSGSRAGAPSMGVESEHGEEERPRDYAPSEVQREPTVCDNTPPPTEQKKKKRGCC